MMYISQRKQKSLQNKLKSFETFEEKKKFMYSGVPHINSFIDIETLKLRYMPFINGVTFSDKDGNLIYCETEPEAYKIACDKLEEYKKLNP